MDFDQLLYHHQMVLIAVSRARRDGHPPSSFDLSDSYARRIAEYRDRRGLDDGPADKRRPGSARLKADPTTSEQATGYADFLGDTFIAELLIHKALSMTPQERSASALEDIVDRLAEIEEARWVIGRDIYRSLGYDEMALAALADNISMDDGGAAAPSIPALHGHRRTRTSRTAIPGNCPWRLGETSTSMMNAPNSSASGFGSAA